MTCVESAVCATLCGGVCGECRVCGVLYVESSVCEEVRVWRVPCVVSAVCGECRVWGVLCVEGSVCGECLVWRVPCVVSAVCGEYHVW